MVKGFWGVKPEIRLELMSNVDFTAFLDVRVAFRGAYHSLQRHYTPFSSYCKGGAPKDAPGKRRKERKKEWQSSASRLRSGLLEPNLDGFHSEGLPSRSGDHPFRYSRLPSLVLYMCLVFQFLPCTILCTPDPDGL